MRLAFAAFALTGLILSMGCGLELTKEEGQERRAAGGSGIAGMGGADMLSAPAPVVPAESQTATEGAAADPAVTESGEPAVGEPSSDPNVETVAAKRGVGKQGRYEGSGMVVTPIKAYFLTKQRTELEMKLPTALKLYQAEHGHFPKTQEDFMRDIIEFSQIRLPQLPEGHRYVYEPKTGELMVERPAQ